MNKLIYILLFVTVQLSAQDYWVTPRGNDSNAGTDSSSTGAWATWQKAFDTADAGDTVYFRGGVWYPTSYTAGSSATQIDPDNAGGYGAHGNNGTYTNPIVFMAYPDDYEAGNFPVLDCKELTAPATNNSGLTVIGATYIEFKGLHIRHLWQKGNEAVVSVDGWVLQDFGVIRIENTASYEHGGAGYQIGGYDTLYFVNNDAYDNCDTVSPTPGNHGDGMRIQDGGGSDLTDTVRMCYMNGNRAWHNSDDGFDNFITRQVDAHSNWSFNNGLFFDTSVGDIEGEGNGFKWAYQVTRRATARLVYNNISAFNNVGHYTTNIYDTWMFGMFLNNTSWFDRDAGYTTAAVTEDYCIRRPSDVRYYNNLVYMADAGVDQQGTLGNCNDEFSDGWPYFVTLSNNTFVQYHAFSGRTRLNPAYTVTSDDFLVNDSATIVDALKASRKPDGSLPDLGSVLKLAPDSDLVDAGIDVGMSTTPDLGVDWDYLGTSTPDPEPTPSLIRYLGSGGKIYFINGKYLK